MRESTQWSVDSCTCKHPVTVHERMTGECSECRIDAHYKGPGATWCDRYQWNEEPRKKVW